MLALILAGCRQNAAELDRRDQESPLLQNAEARARSGDYKGAVKLYQRAMELDPESVRGHLDVAIILHDQLKDYVTAIYHYQRYLELRPQSEKRKMVEERIQKAKQLFAATALQPSHLAAKVSVLENENAELRQQVALLTHQVAAAGQRPATAGTPPGVPVVAPAGPAARPAQAGVPPARPAVQTPAQPPVVPAGATRPPAPAGPRQYTVKRGDTLSRISQQVYGTADRWKEIEAANRKVLGGSQQVKIGQVLTIP